MSDILPVIKNLLFVSVLVASTRSATAQIRRNSLTIGVAKAWISEARLTAYSKSILNMPSLRYERRLNGSFGLAIACSYWKPNFAKYESPFSYLDLRHTKNGDLFERDNYWYFDVIATYGFNWLRNIDFKVGFGISNARGKDYRVTKIVVFPNDIIVETEEKRGNYFGPILELNPVGNFFKNHLSVGPFIDFRYYPSLQSKQIDAGVRLAFNFL